MGVFPCQIYNLKGYSDCISKLSSLLSHVLPCLPVNTRHPPSCSDQSNRYCPWRFFNTVIDFYPRNYLPYFKANKHITTLCVFLIKEWLCSINGSKLPPPWFCWIAQSAEIHLQGIEACDYMIHIIIAIVINYARLFQNTSMDTKVLRTTQNYRYQRITKGVYFPC